MNTAHLHLLVNHLPVFGSILGALVLLYAMWRRSDQTKIAAYLVFIAAALGAGIAYLTGEGAEEVVENVAGISKNMIETHEDFAMISLISIIALGVASIASICLVWKKSRLAVSSAIVVLVLAFVSFGLMTWTGYQGGQIHHTEITGPASATNGQGSGDED